MHQGRVRTARKFSGQIVNAIEYGDQIRFRIGSGHSFNRGIQFRERVEQTFFQRMFHTQSLSHFSPLTTAFLRPARVRSRPRNRPKSPCLWPGDGFIISKARIWWNWQTRYFEVVVGQPVQVQVLLSAPIFVKSVHSRIEECDLK